MPATYEPIATQTLGSATATITFSSIPATYTDLRLVFIGFGTTAGSSVFLRFNSDTAANYSSTYLQGNGGGTPTSAGNTGNASINIASVNTVLRTTSPLLCDINIFSYAGSTNKTLLSIASGDNNGNGGTLSVAGLWGSTTAITAVALTASGSTFAAGATATLYGIKAA